MYNFVKNGFPEHQGNSSRNRPAEPEKMPTAETQRPSLGIVDLSVFVNTVEVTPTLIILCDKFTQRISPYLHVKRLDLGKMRMEQPQDNKRLLFKQEPLEVSKNIVLLAPKNHPFMKLGNNGFIIQPTNVNNIGVNK
ncbi:hypothetical protein TNCV_1294011 [Trichonephila clavipes]|nr:hypothetical protein TNCV_1294011 [Trichonephila clavipes]